MKLLQADTQQVHVLETQLERFPALDMAALIHYLKHGQRVVSARSVTPDKINPSADPIYVAWLTDGVWVWSWVTIVYLERYGVGLDDEFLRHVADCVEGFEVTPESLPEETVSEAREVIAASEEN